MKTKEITAALLLAMGGAGALLWALSPDADQRTSSFEPTACPTAPERQAELASAHARPLDSPSSLAAPSSIGLGPAVIAAPPTSLADLLAEEGLAGAPKLTRAPRPLPLAPDYIIPDAPAPSYLAARKTTKPGKGGGGTPTPGTPPRLSPPPSSLSLVSGDAQTAMAGTALPQPLMVALANRKGQAAVGWTIRFEVTQGAATLSGQDVVTDGQGLASSILTLGNAAGPVQVRASVIGAKRAVAPATFSATAVKPAADALALVSGNNQSGVAGAGLAQPLVVKVSDTAGQPVPGYKIQFSVTAGGGALSATEVAADAMGYASVALILGKVAGTNTVTANGAGLKGSPISFSALGVPGAPSTLALVSGNNQSGALGATLQQPFVVALGDANGNAVANAPLEFRVTAGGGSLSVATVATDAKGQAASVLKLGLAPATNTVVATSPALPNASVIFTATATPVPASAITLTAGDKQSGVAGSPLQNPFQVQVTDANGAPVPGFAVAFAVASGGGSLSATAVMTDVNGYAQTILTLGKTAGANAVSATAQGLTGSPVTFTATGNPGPATTLAIASGDKQTAVVGAPLKDALGIRATDANGNGVAQVVVTFALTAGAGTLSAATATTDAQGLASTTLTVGATAGTINVTATSAGLTGSPATFTLTATAVPPSAMSLTAGDKQTGVAGDALQDPLQVQVTDVNNQPVAGFMVAFTVAAGGGTLSASTVATDVNGYAITTLSLGRVAGANTVTATAQGLTGSPITFSATGTPGPAAVVTPTSGDKQSAVIGTALQAPCVVTVKDKNENPVENYAVTWAVASGGGKLSASATTTDAKGQASSILTVGNTPGANTVTATANGLGGSPLTFSASGIAAPAANLVLVAGDKQTGVAGAPLQNPFQLRVTDAQNNPVEGFNVSFAVAAGGGTLSATDVKTNAMGLASSALTLGQTAGANSVTVTAQGLVGSPMTLTATGLAGPATNIEITDGNNQSGLVATALGKPFVVTVKDANGNPVQGTSVSFAVTAGGGSLSATSVASDAMGQARSTLTLGAAAGTNTVTASRTGLTGSPLTFTAAATSAPATQIAIADGANQTGVAGAPLGKGFVVLVRDAANNPVEGFSVSFAVAAGGGTLSTSDVKTGANGQAATTLTLGTTAGPNTVTANASGLTGSPLSFTATGVAGPATQLAIVSGDKQSAEAGKKLANPLVVAARDANGNPVSGSQVVFAVGAGGGTLSAANVTTGANGQAQTELTLGANAGANTVTATVQGLTPVTFTASGMAAAATQITLSDGNNQSGVAGSKLAKPLAVLVRDAANNPVQGFMVSFAVASGGGSLSATTATSDAMGVASAELTLGTAAGPNTVTANATGLTGSPITFSASGAAGPAAQLDVASGNNQTARAGTPLANPLVVTVRDSNANRVAGATVTFAVAAGGGSLSTTSVASDGNGEALTTLTLGSLVGENRVSATVAGLTPVTFKATALGLTYEDDVKPILTTRCIVCHGPGGVFAARPFTTYEQLRLGTSLGGVAYVVPNDTAGSFVVAKTGAGGTMSAYLSPAQAKTISDWVATGALKDTSGTPLAASMESTSGSGQTAAAAAALPQPFVVTVKDGGGAPVPNVVTLWTVTAGGGMLSGDRITTDALGRATTTLTLGPANGTNTVTAEVTGVSGAPLTFTATAGSAPGNYSGEPLASSTNPLDVAALDALATARIEPAQLSGDEEFARRATSVLLGRLPDVSELQGFLQDTRADKRAQFVDMLLASSEFGAHWGKDLWGPWTGVSPTVSFDNNGTQVTYQYDTPIRNALNNDVPISTLVRDLSTVNGDHGKAFQRTFRGNNETDMADRLMASFTGMSTACARCHDHLLTTPLDDPRWTQDDNYGLYAFFATSTTAARKRDKEGRRFGTALEPAFVADGYNNAVAGLPALADPLNVRRAAFADALTASNAFHRGTAHRIWSEIATPLLNQNQFLQAELATVKSPKLLDALAQAFKDQGTSLKGFLRVCLDSKLFQLTSAGSDTAADPYQGRYAARRQHSEVLEVGVHQLADVQMGNSNGTFRELFGYPNNRSNIADRVDAVNFGQALIHLNYSGSISGKVGQSGSRPRDLASMVDNGAITFDAAVSDLFQAAFSRAPTQTELDGVNQIRMSAAVTNRVLLEDVAAALGASAEFNFR